MIVLMAGLPGTGKSTLAHEIACLTSGRVLSKDEFRHLLFAPEEIEYSSRQDDFCQELMLQTAGYLLARDPARIVFLDGRPFATAVPSGETGAIITALFGDESPGRSNPCRQSDLRSPEK